MTEPTDQQIIALLGETLAVTAHPRPWALWTLPEHLREAALEHLAAFVEDYNATYAVLEEELIWPCWRRHRALVAELAVLWSQWVIAHESAGASAEAAAYWHDRWLPGFQRRVADRWFGTRQERCSWDQHLEAWAPAARVLEKATGTRTPPRHLAPPTGVDTHPASLLPAD